MKTTAISLQQTGRFNRLIIDYIEKNEKLKNYYSKSNTVKNYKGQIELRKQFPIDRELLATALLNQYGAVGGAKEAVLSNIELLRNENAFSVTTGHQLNIFTGPLYFIYKILHTIKLAEELGIAYPEQQFVPIYWMNSEDHDLEEIGQFTVFGKKYEWKTEQTGATGRMNPKSLLEFCKALEEVFANNEQGQKMVSLFKEAYSQYENLATATRYFVNQLFQKYGLVIIDSDDATLKNSFIPFFKKDIFNQEPYPLVCEANKRLKDEGYRVQVNPREINTFYLVKGIRNRIVRTDKGFRVLHTDLRFTESELTTELEKHPERFSPNVVLRPLFQEFIIPNLTYVGGAGELSYWLQYKDYFSVMKVSFPILALRNHFLLIDSGTTKRMEDLGLFSQDLFHSIDQLINDHILAVEETDFNLSDELALVSELYSTLRKKAEGADASLLGSLSGEEKKLKKGIEQWGSRFSRALKQKNEISINRIRKIHSKLFPSGYLQERHDNFIEFSANSNNLLHVIYEGTNPFGTEFRILHLN